MDDEAGWLLWPEAFRSLAGCAKTDWLFRERLTQTGAINGLFNCLAATLRNVGYLPMSGLKLGATLVVAQKQRNTNAEKTDLREGQIPQDWTTSPQSCPTRTGMSDGR